MTTSSELARLIIQQAEDSEAERLARIEEAWIAYDATWDDNQLKIVGFDDNVRLPLAKALVNAGRSFLFGREPIFVVAEAKPNAEDDKAQTDLDAVWEANHRRTLLQEFATNGGVTGDVYVKIVDTGDPADPIRLINLDPANWRSVWDEDDYRTELQFVGEWNTVRPNPSGDPDDPKIPIRKRQTITKRDTGWEIVDEESEHGAIYKETGDQDTWAHDYPPIMHWQNLPRANEYYGESDLEEELVRILKAASFAYSNLQKILRIHAHPKVIVWGAEPDIIDVAVDESITMPGTPQMSGIEILAPQVDVQASLAFTEKLLEAFHQTARTPEIALGRVDKLGPVAGVALQIVYRPLMEKTEDKRGTYGDGLKELNRRILDLLGHANRMTTLTWPDPMPKDLLAEAQTMQTEQAAGVSKRTSLEARGFDPDAEQQNREDEGTAAEEAAATALARPPGSPGGLPA